MRVAAMVGVARVAPGAWRPVAARFTPWTTTTCVCGFWRRVSAARIRHFVQLTAAAFGDDCPVPAFRLGEFVAKRRGGVVATCAYVRVGLGGVPAPPVTAFDWVPAPCAGAVAAGAGAFCPTGDGDGEGGLSGSCMLELRGERVRKKGGDARGALEAFGERERAEGCGDAPHAFLPHS